MRGIPFIRRLFSQSADATTPAAKPGRSAAAASAALPQPGELTWACNICGALNHTLITSMERESGTCRQCSSVMRFRAMMAILTERFCGKVQVLTELARNPHITGLGMSDSDTYAALLAQKFSYTNTYYHCEPLLDIVKPAPQWLGVNDFVISSDVFEHVPPPIQSAFDNMYALLKPGGIAIFSVPFSLEADTFEHYPDLHDFTIRQDENGEWVLDNVSKAGVKQSFRNLVFHGGPGSTLELRLFSQAALQRHFAAAGFTDLRVHNEPHFEHGIFWLAPWSLMLSAVKPA